jgi:hypothetical protein
MFTLSPKNSIIGTVGVVAGDAGLRELRSSVSLECARTQTGDFFLPEELCHYHG